MTRTELEAVAAKHGLRIDGQREGVGKYVDLEIGVGDPVKLRDAHHALIAELRAAGFTARLCGINNRKHPDYGKNYVEVPSFWDE